MELIFVLLMHISHVAWRPRSTGNDSHWPTVVKRSDNDIYLALRVTSQPCYTSVMECKRCVHTYGEIICHSSCKFDCLARAVNIHQFAPCHVHRRCNTFIFMCGMLLCSTCILICFLSIPPLARGLPLSHDMWHPLLKKGMQGVPSWDER